MYGSQEGRKSKRNASHWKVHPGGQAHKSLSLSKSKLCVRNQCTPHQLDRWREISPVNIAKTRFSTKIHFVSSLSPLGEQLKLSFPHCIYFYLHLSQCNLGNVMVAQQQQNVSFPVLWGIHSPGGPEFPAFLDCSSEHPNTNTALLHGILSPSDRVKQWYSIPSGIRSTRKEKCSSKFKAEP